MRKKRAVAAELKTTAVPSLRGRELNSTARALMLSACFLSMVDTMKAASGEAGNIRRHAASLPPANRSSSLSHVGSLNRPDTEQRPGQKGPSAAAAAAVFSARLLPPPPALSSGEVARGTRMCVERIVLLMLMFEIKYFFQQIYTCATDTAVISHMFPTRGRQLSLSQVSE